MTPASPPRKICHILSESAGFLETFSPELVDHQVVGVILQAFEAEPLVSPVLAKVTVHGVELYTLRMP